MMRLIRFLAAGAMGVLFAATLSAQEAFPFQMVVTDQNGNAITVTSGATLNLGATQAGGKESISILVTYQGLNVANLAAPALLGSTEFSVSPIAAATLTTGQSTTIHVTYTATSSSQATAQLSIPFTETAAGGAASSAPISSGSITFSLVGTAPQFLVSYYLQAVQNVISLADGGTLTFPPTLVPNVSQAVVQIQNAGSGAGLINSVQVTGAAFQVTNVPSLPGVLNAGATLQFGIIYTPTQSGTDTGTMTITFPDHTVTVTLMGTGTAPAFTYQLVVSGQTSTIAPNQTLSFTSTPLVSVPFTIIVTNTGTGSAALSGLSLAGLGFQQVDVPSSLILTPGAFLSLDYAFTPPAAGSFPGRLGIGNAVFTLAGTSTGPQLTYSFTLGSAAPLTVFPGGTVPFSPVQIGQSEFGTFSIQNIGTAPATIISISVASAQSAFSLAGLPGLPVTLAPNATTSFTIGFAPFTTILSSSVLQIDNASFTLTGSGNPPPPLPTFSFQGAGGAIAALQQPSIGVTLQTPYPLAITGSLTITQNPQGFNADPAVQFSTGGANVAFTIPANTTQAVFPNNANSVRMQTGSVANTITVTPAFATTGAFNLTPSNVPTLQFTVAAGPPQLSNVSITSTAANGFTLQIVGAVTSRSLTTLNFTFAAETKFNIANTSVPVDLSSVAANWFQSSASAAFGGQFQISVPFNLTSNNTSLTAALPAIQSVSVTAVNPQGTSNAVTTTFQ